MAMNQPGPSRLPPPAYDFRPLYPAPMVQDPATAFTAPMHHPTPQRSGGKTGQASGHAHRYAPYQTAARPKCPKHGSRAYDQKLRRSVLSQPGVLLHPARQLHFCPCKGTCK